MPWLSSELCFWVVQTQYEPLDSDDIYRGMRGASSLLSQAVTTDSPGGRRHVVSWEHPRKASPQGCPLEPAILTLLKDTVHLTLAQLQLVILLGLVGI